jgi:hypothetical protein
MGAWQITSKQRILHLVHGDWLQASSRREQVAATESGKVWSLSGGRKVLWWSGGKGSEAAGGGASEALLRLVLFRIAAPRRNNTKTKTHRVPAHFATNYKVSVVCLRVRWTRGWGAWEDAWMRGVINMNMNTTTTRQVLNNTPTDLTLVVMSK